MPVPTKNSAHNHPARRGYCDKHGVAAYFNTTTWQVDEWLRQGILKPGVTMTPGGKRFFAYRELDAAYERAARSRQPRREPRGIVKQRLEGTHRPAPRKPEDAPPIRLTRSPTAQVFHSAEQVRGLAMEASDQRAERNIHI
jgi:hypothetical protein